jgi:hypothetical protein
MEFNFTRGRHGSSPIPAPAPPTLCSTEQGGRGLSVAGAGAPRPREQAAGRPPALPLPHADQGATKVVAKVVM